ncbi:acetyl/propionyl/methylcrotonyl-CoA carboxylase subunit alpha [Rhizobium sp. BK376]|uniref:acetyl/propionyl/methylcrotonyl-CoA carboxylase subunit alpha n=1 Tax=Rhizobium sp. BK376 TaxID=2512149 RepID=UPI00104F9341|nr:acetyl/propionyl/methylcrotonyl-CoA carboxylase subunit alpha [Rhizobium sp. BK376]TCR82453.1 3-methylcrotonyl-CoA carboxylase alpha subunit [Rhizobium sp. BK376]
MFDKILIANRGEIACRVIRTAKRMGIRTAAVYSDADIGALHVELADEAFRLGAAPAAESYLSIERIVAVARRSGAQAVHPGYGFLSENGDFAAAVEAAGLVFIGPPPDAIRAMGRKDVAKMLMERAGVPIVPGYHGDNQDAGFLAERAEEIGYPVIIKARAGGGGKGMRRVERSEDFSSALDAARREAQGAFGDNAVLVEKYLVQPRHIEIQVFGDRHGNMVHLFERDCSLQRRHQKVIEEAPAPGMTDEMRRAMGDAAVRAAQAIGYRGAGTVEFIVDASSGLWPDRFFFMEMNTRLQVEHPVTEAITHLDLVEWQLRVAAGEPLPKKQADLEIDGWAFEARIYAEDPAHAFLPAIGTLSHLTFPDDDVRIDTGVRAGDQVSPYYDPLIAKLIVHAPSRREGLGKLTRGLQACRIGGVTTNLDFLTRLSKQGDFVAGHPDTGLIDRQVDALTSIEPPGDAIVAAAAVLSLDVHRAFDANDPWQALGHWQQWGEMSRIVTLEHAYGRILLRVIAKGRDLFVVQTDQRMTATRIIRRLEDGCLMEVDGRQMRIQIFGSPQRMTLLADGKAHEFHVPDMLAGGVDHAAGSDHLVAPMPGFVKIVRVRPGDTVSTGDALIVMEAMKMELTLAAMDDGVVENVHVAEGDQVAEGTVLLSLEPKEAS